MSKKFPEIEIWMDVEVLDENDNVIDAYEVLVRGDYTPACRGSRDAYGQAMEPDEPERVDFISAEKQNGEEVSLCADDYKRAMILLNEATPEPDDRGGEY